MGALGCDFIQVIQLIYYVFLFFFYFTLQLLATSDFVLQNTALHHYKGAEGNFIIFDGISSIDKKCADNNLLQ